jgi:hypothetical protein
MIATLDVRGNLRIMGPSGWKRIRSDDNGNINFKATYFHEHRPHGRSQTGRIVPFSNPFGSASFCAQTAPATLQHA